MSTKKSKKNWKEQAESLVDELLSTMGVLPTKVSWSEKQEGAEVLMDFVQQIAEEADRAKQLAQTAERGNKLIEDALRVALQSWSGKALQAEEIREVINRKNVSYSKQDRMDSGEWQIEREYTANEVGTLREAMKLLQEKGKATR